MIVDRKGETGILIPPFPGSNPGAPASQCGVGAAGDAEHLDHGAAVVQKLRRLAVIALDIDPVGTVDRLNSRAKRIDLNGRVPGRVNRGEAFSAARRLASRSQPQQADQERAPIAG